jgi:peptidoglycan/xylan/chitin deacetylase (PgdA/CDA1 family)
LTISQKIRAKLLREAKYLRNDVQHFLGFDEHFYKKARGSRILIYHGICLHDHTRFNPIFLTLKTFEQHLQLYKKYFNVISLDDHYKGNLSKDKFNVCITFDDGYANNHKYVLPLLEKYQVPATFFITAIREAGYDILWNDFMNMLGKYGPAKLEYNNKEFYKGKYNKYISKPDGINLTGMLRNGGFNIKAELIKAMYPIIPYRDKYPGDIDYWLQMTPEQIRELSASKYVSIGAHGHYHNDLAQISLNDAANEMALSKHYLENIIDKPVNSFAFPYGTYTRDIVKAAKNIGYDQLLPMDFRFSDDYEDEAMKERFIVNPFISPINQMRAIITHSYER